ncbi:MAG: mraZ protein [Puniceicoccaceae bacterium 5H]|nr:MAG: mraZ protein [Puniceicoccaceae bacterium 5H]
MLMVAEDADTFDTKVYVGEYSHRLDQRGRVTVPSDFRVEGDEGNYYFAWPHPEGYVAVFPPAMQQELLEKTRAIKQSDRDGQKMLRQLFGNGCQFGCDKQGRILIPQKLLQKVGIEKDVTFVGTGRTFQIWSTERYTTEDEEDFDFVSTMSALGI